MEHGWYERLENYFPEHELKSPAQMEELFEEHPAYLREQTDEYLIIYANFEEFIFIDYLLVNPKTRGGGIGTRVINAFKQRGKTLLAEVEPATHANPDTEKRVHFYLKNGFRKAQNIDYTRETADGTSYTMDIYYWSPSSTSERDILEQMQVVCDQIHNFHAKQHYGRLPADPDDVLTWKP
ncbi:GNAT family N-acetyltransferase [Alicyclobacillus fastidiosus]|uniref:GNAT family N-acetyltransferase n=1 Tax=Alicyclobacillus fastidiosus TaxID=392011 RepID=A0ABY6ZN44_9BACL|nr:GNAT family N-acetyltransferase [Alicyclobacillus fastidiosus]WAH43998.1 GNAT family N-acetyltransferase [Alicyclobacillus fastidiosus]GMA60276.1 putative acetyltransferase YjbC [Alicyclobacillus fastidiosus]